MNIVIGRHQSKRNTKHTQTRNKPFNSFNTDADIIGLVHLKASVFEVITVNKKEKFTYQIFNPDSFDIHDGDLVEFKVIKQTHKGRKTHFAKINKILKSKVNKAESTSFIALEEHKIPYKFPQSVLEEIDKIQEITHKNTNSKRHDLTDLPFITIDPKDARDHDDAVYAKIDSETGGAEIYIAIADVSAYVYPESEIEQEAQKRGNSTYLPDKVIPMLPEHLSNNLCSLKADRIKPVLVVKINIDANGKKLKHKFMRAFIQCRANLSYEDIYLASQDSALKQYKHYQKNIIQPLILTYQMLQVAHAKRAPLDLDIPEYKIILDASAKPIDIVKKERLFTHRLIEEFMVLANVCAAETLEDTDFSIPYRIHETPTDERVANLKETLKEINIPFHKNKNITPKIFNKLLVSAQDTAFNDLITKMILRTQCQAIYNTQNQGHFGLNLKQYVHFTSPIRRYADLLIHRHLINHIEGLNTNIINNETQDIPQICQHISMTERRSMKAELETKDRFLAMFLQNKVTDKFVANISGLTNSGIFVRLSSYGAEGFIPIHNLSKHSNQKRFFKVNDTRHMLQDVKSGQYYIIGQIIHVSLTEVNTVTGNMIFSIINDNDLQNSPFKNGKKIKKHKSFKK